MFFTPRAQHEYLKSLSLRSMENIMTRAGGILSRFPLLCVKAYLSTVGMFGLGGGLPLLCGLVFEYRMGYSIPGGVSAIVS